MWGSLVVPVLILVLVVYGIFLFNQLVSLKHNVGKAWSNIDILLKQRHDELPKLVETCKQYMKFEQETLERVMQARNQVASARQSQNIGALGQAEGALRAGPAAPRFLQISLSKLMICAWIETSKAVVGSSATINLGSAAKASAITTRWRMPPLNWCGK